MSAVREGNKTLSYDQYINNKITAFERKNNEKILGQDQNSKKFNFNRQNAEIIAESISDYESEHGKESSPNHCKLTPALIDSMIAACKLQERIVAASAKGRGKNKKNDACSKSLNEGSVSKPDVAAPSSRPQSAPNLGKTVFPPEPQGFLDSQLSADSVVLDAINGLSRATTGASKRLSSASLKVGLDQPSTKLMEDAVRGVSDAATRVSDTKVTVDVTDSLATTLEEVTTAIKSGVEHNVEVKINEETLAKLLGAVQGVKVDVSANLHAPGFAVLAEKIERFLPGFSSSSVPVVLSLLGIYCCFKMANTDKPKWAKIAGGVATTLTLITQVPGIGDLMAALIRKMSNFTREKGVEAQATVVDTMSKLICAIVAKCTFGNLKSDSFVTEFFSKTKDLPRIHDSVKFMFEAGLQLVERFLNFVRERIGMSPLVLSEELFPQVRDYHIEVANVLAEFHAGKVMNWENGKEVLALEKKGQTILAGLPNVVEAKEAKVSVIRVLNELKPLLTRLERANVVGNGPRRDPLGILFVGPSGVGKSTMVTPLMVEVTAAVIPDSKLKAFEANHNDEIYNRIHETIFWDGYHGQFNLYIDDIGQLIDVAGGDNTIYMETIRAINTANYQLHMAHLEDKGNTNFVSELVWATSNQKKFKLNSIYDTEAFTRRFELTFLTTCKRSYSRDYTPDTSLVNDAWSRRLCPLQTLTDDFDHLEFYKYDSINGTIKDPNPLSYAQVRELIIETYRRKKKFGDKVLDMHNVMKSAAIKRRISETIAKRGVVAQSNCLDPLYEYYMPPKDSKGVRVINWFNCMSSIVEEYEPRLEPEVTLRNSLRGGKCVDVNSCYVTFLALCHENPSLVLNLCDSFDDDYFSGLPVPKKDVWAYTPLDFAKVAQFTGTCMNYYMHAWASLGALRAYNAEDAILAMSLAPYVAPGRHYQLIMEHSIAKTAGRLGATLQMASNILSVTLCCLQAYKMFKSYSGSTVLEVTDEKAAEITEPLEAMAQSSFRANVLEKRGGGRSKATQREAAKSCSRFVYRPKAEAQSEVCNESWNAGSHPVPLVRDLCKKIFNKSIFLGQVNGSSSHVGYFTFVFAHVAVVPLHVIETLMHDLTTGAIAPGTLMKVWRVSNVKQKFELDPRDLRVFSMDHDSDFAFVLFPNVLPRAPDLSRHFSPLPKTNGRFQSLFLRPSLGVEEYNDEVIPVYPRESLEYGEYAFDVGYEYNLNTKKGDCGALLVSFCTKANKVVVVGMHVAGGNGHGMSVALLSADVEAVKAQLGPEASYDEPGVLSGPAPELDGVAAQGFNVLGRCKPVHSPNATQLRKSPLWNTYAPSVQEPAMLRSSVVDGVVVDPWANARAVYRRDSVYLRQNLIDIVTDSYVSAMVQKSDDDVPWQPRVLSFEEAVAGIPGVPFIDGVPRGTSAGYPWILSVPPGMKGKQQFFGSEGEYEFVSDSCKVLRARVESILVSAENNLRLDHFFVDYLKDEKRDVAKVRAGKTRMICAGPLDLSIAMRMHFLDLERWIMRNRVRNGSAIGINPYGEEWHMLARALTSGGGGFGNCMIAGDYSKYDSSLTRQVMSTFLVLADAFYGPQHSRVRRVLMEEVLDSKHVSLDYVYSWSNCNPSGQTLTGILNTFCNNILIRYASCVLLVGRDAPTRDLVSSAELVERNMVVVCYGDDNIISVGPLLRDKVTQSALTLAFAGMGMTYTSEDKGETTHELRCLSDVSFLKRGFRFDRGCGKFLAPLSLGTILEMPQWHKKADRDCVYLKDTVFTALRELSLHEEELFDKWASPILRAAFNKLGYRPPLSKYELLQELARTCEDLL